MSDERTYGEAVDELIDDVEAAIDGLEEARQEYLDKGGIGNTVAAAVIEMKIRELTEAAAELDDRRRRMPFG